MKDFFAPVPALTFAPAAQPPGDLKLKRRTLLIAAPAAAAALLLAKRSNAQARPDDAFKLGQSVALTGPLADLGIALSEGAKAAFAELNAKGGVNGRQIALTTVDDGYDTQRALDNASRFAADPSVFALFNCMGTPMVEAMLPLVRESGIVFFAPFTGALSVRSAGLRNVLNVRANYPEEAEQQLRHLATIGARKIAVAYQNNRFGKEIYNSAQAAFDRLGLIATASVPIEDTAQEILAAADRIVKSEPDAVLVFMADKPAVDFIKAIRVQRRALQVCALSVMGAASVLKALGADAAGIALSQVVPLPTATVVPIVRDFQQAWKSAGKSQAASHAALEGYINARVFAEVLARAVSSSSNAVPTLRAAFIDSAWNLQRYNMSGFNINFSTVTLNASRFVEMTLVNRDGRIIG